MIKQFLAAITITTVLPIASPAPNGYAQEREMILPVPQSAYS